jgi:signal transduction histidine kinase
LERAIKDKRDDVNELSLRVSKTLVEQIDNLAQIATQFSQFAKISSSNAEQFNLIELLQNVTSLFAEQNENVKIELKLQDEFATVFADKNQFLSVFNNLVLNAIQAIPEERKGEIVVEEKIIADKIIITITDNGIGIDEEKTNKIFEPNFTTKSSGTGLGLAIAKAIIENANGKIEVESKLDEGTKFEITLPTN